VRVIWIAPDKFIIDVPAKKYRIGNKDMEDLRQVECHEVAAKETGAKRLAKVLVVVEEDESSHDGAC